MKKRITITLDPDIIKAAKIKAVEDDTNFSALIENLLSRYLRGDCPAVLLTDAERIVVTENDRHNGKWCVTQYDDDGSFLMEDEFDSYFEATEWRDEILAQKLEARS